MTDRGEKERIIEQRVHAALRELPTRRAPATLAARVQAEIERRAALPWWRRRFGEWPPAARVGFVLASLAVVCVLVFLAPLSQQTLPAHPLTALPGAGQAQALLASVAVLRSVVLHAIPSGWLTIGLVLSGTLYALLFGLGAAAYRALYVPLQRSYR